MMATGLLNDFLIYNPILKVVCIHLVVQQVVNG
jgi:hypothetical protein